MELILENWRKFLTEGDVLRIGASNRNIENQKSPELYGNCGMLAIALLEEGIKRNKEVQVVFLHSTEDPLEDEDYELYHVAMYYNGKYYDDRGETTEKEMSSLVPLGLTTPQNEEPRQGRDYNLDSYIVDNMQGLDYIYKIVESLTGWSKTCDEYRQRSIKFWDGIDNETPT